MATANAGMACGTVDTRHAFRGMLSSDAEIQQQTQSITFAHQECNSERMRIQVSRGSLLIKVNMAFRIISMQFGLVTPIGDTQFALINWVICIKIQWESHVSLQHWWFNEF